MLLVCPFSAPPPPFLCFISQGDYTNFLKRREEAWTMRKRLYENQQKKIAELKEFINEAKTSDNPGTANQVPARIKMLEKLEAEAVPEPIEVKEFRFQFPVPGKLDHDLLQINDMSFSYNPNDEEPEKSKMLLKHVNLHMDMESRIGVLGVNGAGKSTLIKLIRGKLEATLGICRVNQHARHVLFTQHHIDQLDLTKSTLDFLQARFPNSKEHQIRGMMVSHARRQQQQHAHTNHSFIIEHERSLTVSSCLLALCYSFFACTIFRVVSALTPT